eukprot:9734747-Heterocapsa_arctica.AAC.1
MPCSSVKPRVKPKFIEVTPSDIETYEVDVFKRYRYAINRERDKPLRVVNRVDGGEHIVDWTTYAVARYRAIELANGDGFLNDPAD